MPVLNSLTAAQCALINKRLEATPLLLILSEICPAAPVDDIWFKAIDQRGGATLTPSVQYGNATNQANPTGIRYESGKTVQLDIELGRKTLELNTLSRMLGATVQTDATTATTKFIDIKPSPGAIPTHYQVLALPYGQGGVPRFDFGILMPYAVPTAENTQIGFDINTPISGSFSFVAEPEEGTEIYARVYESDDGSNIQQLLDVAAEYLTANPLPTP